MTFAYRSTARRLVILLLALVAIPYGGAALWLISQETRLVFEAGRPLGPGRPADPFEEIILRRDDGLRQIAWLLRNGQDDAERGWALFLHGNAATIASRANIVRYEQLRALGLDVFAPEYRGFGGLDGVPTEAGLYADARAAYDHMRTALGARPERLVIYGWSLGAAVAVDLAAQVPHAALVLEGAPASLVDIGQERYPLFPVRLIMRNPFDAILRIARVRSPILFLHSPDDKIVPLSHGRRLFDAASTSKRFVEVRGGHIRAAEVDGPLFIRSIGELLAQAGIR